mmetsp:Transcript_13812/g.23553  ORF Transcript_13812/g.23553 Transcript_13812/m.23553 type:complete len:279 (-) Transcript_13812:1937-2773(-)
MLDVNITMVFLKSTFVPLLSVTCPSSSSCNITLNTSGCAFSISSNSNTEYGRRRTASVSCPPSSYPTYPGGAPSNLDTVCFSMYSLISSRIMASSVSNMNSDRAFASSVLPTPVGPRKIIEAIGFDGSFIPALDLWMASVTISIASSCPTTRSLNLSAIVRTRSLSVSINFADGMPVHTDMTLAISSGTTSSRNIFSPSSCEPSPSSAASSFDCAACNCSSNCGSVPYFNSAALFKSYSRSAFSISNCTSASFSCNSFTPSTASRSDCQRAVSAACSS